MSDWEHQMLHIPKKIMPTTDPELSVSPTPVVIMLAILSMVLLFVGEDKADIVSRTQWEVNGLMILVWTLVVWRISSTSVLVSKWVIIVVLVALVICLRFSSIKFIGILELF